MFVGVRVAPVLAAAALVGVLAGCSGSSDEPHSLPPLSTTPVSTSSPAPPDNKTALSQAEAVVREYFRLINDLRAHMDYRGLDALMAPDCACRKQVTAIKRAAAKGEHFIDRARHLDLVATRDAGYLVQVLATYDVTAGGLVDDRGRTITSAKPRQDVKRLFRLCEQGGRWLIYAIESL